MYKDGSLKPFDSDKVLARIEHLTFGLDKRMPIKSLIDRLSDGIYDNVTSSDVDGLMAETAATMTATHPDFSFLAARILISRLHKETEPKFSHAMKLLYSYKNRNSGDEWAPKISTEIFEIIMQNASKLDETIEDSKDYDYNFFGFKTLEKAYLLKCDKVIVERPQYMLMRVAVGIHGTDIARAIETYHLMSKRKFIHASPTLFNSGTPRPQMSSCFLVSMKDDSIDGIFDTLRTCALISKGAGGIGIHAHNIRARGSYIKGTGGFSSGLVPMLRIYNDAARYVDQGGNRRPGAFAIYLEPWHADVFDFLELRKNHGKEESRARDLFYALWIPDLFMEKVEKNEQWCLFSPDQAPGLSDVYGEEFEQLYNKYEQEGKYVQKVKAQKLWYAILQSQTETGTPFMLYKDSCNKKSNQKNVGVIKSSNLCTEIVEYSSPDEVAVCNLASMGLPAFLTTDKDNIWFDFKELHKVVKVVVRNLNRIIDINNYPVEEAKRSNFRHRPIAIGVQGLADVFMALKLPYDSEQAARLNIQIFETIYHAAVESSIDLAKESGPYETYEGSPASKGLLQYDLWGHKPSDLWNDWDNLKNRMATYGLRNSLLVAPMPTASTSQILGYTECFEPYTSNIYTRRVLSGEFQVVNGWLLRDLIELGIWDDDMKNKIIANEGSIQNIPGIPDQLKKIYKTVWELSQKSLINMAADRSPFIDQSQSLNIHIKDATMGKLTSMHFYGWKKGLKTGMYYLRTQAASAPIQFTVDQEKLKNEQKIELVPKQVENLLGKRKYIEANSPITNMSDATTTSSDDDDAREEDDEPLTFDEDGERPAKIQRTAKGNEEPPVAARKQSSSYNIYCNRVIESIQYNGKDEEGNCDMCSG